MDRRRFLALVSSSTLPLAGCLDAGMPHDAIIRAVRSSQSTENVTVSYDDLPPAEQEIAKTAIEEDLYHACPDLPDAVYSFAHRFETAESAYLGYQGTAYAMWIRIEDMIPVSTASPPEKDPSCGGF